MISQSRLLRIRPIVILLLTVSAFVSLAPPARAAHCRIGRREFLKELQNLDLKGPAGEQLYLGYKFTHYMACLPYTLSDDGYVLGVKGQQRYIPLDDARRIALQQQGVLPTPLPPYRIALVDVIFGHLLWAMLVFIPLGIWMAWRRRARLNRALPSFNSGLAHLSRGEFGNAVEAFTAAGAIAPKSATIFLHRGHALAAMNDFDGALADYSRAIIIEPKNVRALLGRASMLRLLGNLKGALADCTRAVKLLRSDATYCARGAIRTQLGDFKGAVGDFTQAAKINPMSVPAYKMRADAYAQLGMTELANQDLRRLEQFAPAAPRPAPVPL